MARRSRRSCPPACENGKHSRSVVEKISDEFDLPGSVVPGTSHIELSGNRYAVVEGCKGVLEYNDTAIKLNLGKTAVRFTGYGLTINTYCLEQAVISGDILTIDFST